MKIRFFKTYITGSEIKYINNIISKNLDSSGDGFYTKKVHKFLEKRYGVYKALLTTSCTTALEFAVRLCGLNPGDEIIVPSFTFSSTANAVLMANRLKVVFADVKADTLNIDPEDIKKKITPQTRAIIVVHYAGVACDMDEIMSIAGKYKLKVIEDAAQAIDAKYKDKYLGTIGDFGCLSFHDTKNITCGEGGALLINRKNKKLFEQAEIIREKGTNRSKFFRGQVDKYTWVSLGSSYLPSDLLAAYLFAQLENIDEIISKRIKVWNYFYKSLIPLAERGIIQLMKIPIYSAHNAHIFFVLFKSIEYRDNVMNFMKKNGVQATFHYIPLHSAPQGLKLGFDKGDLPITENISQCLLRLPIYSSMSKREQDYVISVFKKSVEQINIMPAISIKPKRVATGNLRSQVINRNQNLRGVYIRK